jgi:hypothetical protein
MGMDLGKVDSRLQITVMNYLLLHSQMAFFFFFFGSIIFYPLR